MIQPQSLIKGRYRLGRRLGEGGMAIVFLGHDLHLGRDVAIKTLRPQFAADPAFRARFEREARAAASLSHPNIIDVHDVGEVDGVPFLVMELVRGQSLKEVIATEAPFHPDDVAELLEQIGSALDYAHARGYVHRDVKPGNVLIDEHGRVRVVDFGIAKGLADTDLTATGTGLGTVGYLSPEQAQGLMATPASDIYSAGIIAYEMLTGALPFHAETPVGVAMQHVNEPAPRPSAARPSVSRQVDATVLCALDKDPTRRWPSVGAFASALKVWRTEIPSAPLTGRMEPTTPEPARSSLAPTLIVIVLVVAVTAALLQTGLQGLPEMLSAEGSREPRPPQTVITVADSADEPSNRDGGAEIESAPNPTPTSAAQPTTSAPGAPAPTIAPAAEPVVVVPNLQGLTIAGSTGALLPLGLRIALAQPVHSTSIPMNAVVSQEPPPGSAVEAGTVVHVSLSRGPSPFGNSAP